MRTCSMCGYQVTPANNFCANCGTRYEPAPAAAATGSQEAPPGQYGSPRQSPAQPGPYGPPPPAMPGPAAHSPGNQSPGNQWQGNQWQGNQWQGNVPGGNGASGYGASGYGMPVPFGYGTPPATTLCANCGQALAATEACGYCGQVRGLPNGITLSSAGRRFGGYLLEGLLFLCTLGIGWLIWTLVVWAQGQTPAKQVLGMRVVRLDRRTYAGWGRMFLRDFVGKLVVWVVGYLLLFIGYVVGCCWLLWDKDRQELWDKIAGTIVVNDPDKRLLPPAPVR